MCKEASDIANTKIETRTLPEQICDYLVDLINTGALRPGQPLRLASLCKDHDLTQTPLREALRLLASQDLAEYTPHRGYRVAEVNEQQLASLYDVREALEGMAARRLAERATDAQLRQLASLAGQHEGLPFHSKRRLSADRRFHGFIAEFSGNPVIGRLLLAPTILSGSMVRRLAPPADVSGHVSHDAVVDAIASGVPDEAERVMRAHVRWGAQVRLAQLTDSTPSAPETG